MKSNQSKKVVLLVFLGFVAYYILFANFKPIKLALDSLTKQGLLSYVLTYFIVGIPIFLSSVLINKAEGVLKGLGLSSRIMTGPWTSFLFTLPMFIGGLLFFKFNIQIDIQKLIAGTIVAGFMEELYFRGFLFGQLFRNAKFGFIPAIFLGALIFAFGHLYQSQDITELAGIFMITFFGAIFFAWLYVEWHYNLWVPIFTHTLMNLSWNLFAVDNSALGDVKANVFRGLTILLAIVFTVMYKRRKGEPLAVNKQTLMLRKMN